MWRRLTRPVPLVTGVVGDLLRSRRELITENALLRQQLIVASRKVKRPAFQPHERGLLVLLARLVPRRRDALLLVTPGDRAEMAPSGVPSVLAPQVESRCSAGDEAGIRSHRPHPTNGGEQPTWGSERIRGEPLKLGIHVSKRTILSEQVGEVQLSGDRMAGLERRSLVSRVTSTRRLSSRSGWQTARLTPLLGPLVPRDSADAKRAVDRFARTARSGARPGPRARRCYRAAVWIQGRGADLGRAFGGT
jgi:hypothetical protein